MTYSDISGTGDSTYVYIGSSTGRSGPGGTLGTGANSTKINREPLERRAERSLEGLGD